MKRVITLNNEASSWGKPNAHESRYKSHLPFGKYPLTYNTIYFLIDDVYVMVDGMTKENI